MTLIVTAVHILVSLALVFVVLLQKGSGADMGAAFGGSSQGVFGARGSGSFLGKLTALLATLFMITSMTLAFFTVNKGPGASIMDRLPFAASDSSTTKSGAKSPAKAGAASGAQSTPDAATPTPPAASSAADVPGVPPAAPPPLEEGGIPSVPKSGG